MTESVFLRRARRRADPKKIPDDLVEWFEGKTSVTPWSALLPGDWDLLPRRWAAWLAKHSGAVAPPGLTCLVGGEGRHSASEDDHWSVIARAFEPEIAVLDGDARAGCGAKRRAPAARRKG